MRKLMTIRELAEIIDLSDFTLRTYLGNYRFSEFITKARLGGRYKSVIIFNRKFAYKLSDYLRLYRHNTAIEKLIEYCEKQENF